jgi:transcriptional regulator with XRE-family HTH domain
MHIGERIRVLREERGLTGEQLASKLERGSQTIYRWEWGKTSPRWDDLQEIAKALDVEVSRLTDGVEPSADSTPPSAM